MTNKAFCVKHISCILEKSLSFIFYEVIESFDGAGRRGGGGSVQHICYFVVGVPDA